MNNPKDAIVVFSKNPGKVEISTRLGSARIPDLAILHGDPEFERLYPPASASAA